MPIGGQAKIPPRDDQGNRAHAAMEWLGGGITSPEGFAALAKGERKANRKKWKKADYNKRWPRLRS